MCEKCLAWIIKAVKMTDDYRLHRCECGRLINNAGRPRYEGGLAVEKEKQC